MTKNKTILFILYIVICTLPLYSQLAYDTLLFTIPLIDDASHQSLFNVHKVKWVREALSGPVVMTDDNFLFYSEKGYLLYNQRGSIIDSHSVFKNNEGMAKNDPERITLAFPITDNTILYYNSMPRGQYPFTIFAKKLFKRSKTTLDENKYKYLEGIRKRHIYNFAFNTVTDEMRECYYALPRLIGFTSLSSGDNWWSVDKIYSFLSPLVNEEDGKYKSFFPGITLEKDRNRFQTLEPLQIFTRDNKWFFTGTSAGGVGSLSKKRVQTYFVFDQAGNPLYADTLLKLFNIDEIIGEDEETYYTAKKVKRNVFKPSVSRNGDVFYGIIDYKKKKIEVRKRQYYIYRAFSCDPGLTDLVDNEKCAEFIPVELKCDRKSAGNPVIPKITLLDIKTDKYVRAQEEHLTKNGYICYIRRIPNRDVKKKLARGRGGVSREIRAMFVSLYKDLASTCPYSLSLVGPKGTIRSFNYPPGEEIVCARVLAMHKRDEFVVRVDCRTYAEALIFKTDGSYVNRFIFNRQNYEDRLDIIVTSKNSPIIELDYESDPETHTYYQWKRCLYN